LGVQEISISSERVSAGRVDDGKCLVSNGGLGAQSGARSPLDDMHATVRKPERLAEALPGQWQGIVTGEWGATERRGSDEGNDREGR
jgi:hypothetical protein